MKYLLPLLLLSGCASAPWPEGCEHFVSCSGSAPLVTTTWTGAGVKSATRGIERDGVVRLEK